MRAGLPASILLLAASATASAQGRHDSAAPVDFGADHIELQDRANRVVLAGSVALKQGEMTLNADRMIVSYTGQAIGGNPQVSRFDAAGSVTVRRPAQTARSQYAVYDLNRRVITMVGGVKLDQGGNTVSGARLTLDLDSGHAVIDGSGVAGGSGSTSGGTTTAPGGRVTGTFSVPKRN